MSVTNRLARLKYSHQQKSKLKGGFVITPVIIALIIGVYLLSLGEGFRPDFTFLDQYSIRGPQVHQGELYRMVTALFIHFDLFHLAMNGFALWIMGALIERMVGSLRFLTIFLIGGLLGALFSTYLNSPVSMAAGASGAIMGLLGYLIGARLQLSSSIPKDLWQWALSVLLINGVWNFFNTSLDVWGHFGGFMGGLVAAFVVGVPWYARVAKSPGRQVLSVLRSVVILIGLGLLIISPADDRSISYYEYLQDLSYQVSQLVPEGIRSDSRDDSGVDVQPIPHPLANYNLSQYPGGAEQVEQQVRRIYSVPIKAEVGRVHPFAPQSYATYWSREVAEAFFQRFLEQNALSAIEETAYRNTIYRSAEESIQVQLYLFAHDYLEDVTDLSRTSLVERVVLETSDGRQVLPTRVSVEKPFEQEGYHLSFTILEFPVTAEDGTRLVREDTSWVRIYLYRNDGISYFDFQFQPV